MRLGPGRCWSRRATTCSRPARRDGSTHRDAAEHIDAMLREEISRYAVPA